MICYNIIVTKTLNNQIKKIPALAGVYLFKDKRGRVIYVGKSANLKNRVRSYFQIGASFYNAAKIKMLEGIYSVNIIETNSEIEALIKETELIKKLKPKFNVLMRDSKNYLFVGINREDYPRIYYTHQPFDSLRSLKVKPKGHNSKAKDYIGPFTDATALRKTLHHLRTIFPYCTCKQKHFRLCLNAELGKCLGECCLKTNTLMDRKKEYNKNISSIKRILSGRSKVVQQNLRREIKTAAKEKNYEQAQLAVERLSHLEAVMSHAHVLGSGIIILPLFQDVRPNFKLLGLRKEPQRIEAYDVSNISGQEAVGSMIVFEKTERGDYHPKKSDYRKFKIKSVRGANDPAMIREILFRRLKHTNWPKPGLIVIDGGKAQLNAALGALGKRKIPIIALAKRLEEIYFPQKKQSVLAELLGSETKRLLQALRDETHRFAIKFHRQLHKKAVIKTRSS